MGKHHNHFRWLVGIGIIACFLWIGNARAQLPQTIMDLGADAMPSAPLVTPGIGLPIRPASSFAEHPTRPREVGDA